MNRIRIFYVCSFGLLIWQSAAAQSLVQNGDFSKWKGNLPANWMVETGARSNDASIKSKISKGVDGRLEITGNAKTNNWLFLSQTFDVKPGEKYTASFEAKATNVRREDGQRDNCYVGVILKDKQGRVVKFDVSDVRSRLQTQYKRYITIPRTASKAVVAIFLSKTGKLSVKSAEFKRVFSKDSFRILVDDMDRYYSYFQHKKIDWAKLTAKYEGRANAVATEPDKFAKVVLEMLSELKDSHVWLAVNGKRMYSYSRKWEPNFDFKIVDGDLVSVKKFGNLGLVSKTSDGFGYVRVNSLSNVKLEYLNDMVEAIEKQFGTPGMIIDIRRNSGGSEYNAQLIASIFAPKRTVYAKQSRRSGPKHSDLRPTDPRVIGPGREINYTKPIVCLMGPGAVSSGEGMAMMFKAFNNCTTLGQPTRGSSGNPMPVVLPNGVEVWYSRWVAMMPDGTVIEDNGVVPEVLVDHEKGKDRTYAKAIEILKGKTK